jgi:hypothetical protein
MLTFSKNISPLDNQRWRFKCALISHEMIHSPSTSIGATHFEFFGWASYCHITINQHLHFSLNSKTLKDSLWVPHSIKIMYLYSNLGATIFHFHDIFSTFKYKIIYLYSNLSIWTKHGRCLVKQHIWQLTNKIVSSHDFFLQKCLTAGEQMVKYYRWSYSKHINIETLSWKMCIQYFESVKN